MYNYRLYVCFSTGVIWSSKGPSYTVCVWFIFFFVATSPQPLSPTPCFPPNSSEVEVVCLVFLYLVVHNLTQLCVHAVVFSPLWPLLYFHAQGDICPGASTTAKVPACLNATASSKSRPTKIAIQHIKVVVPSVDYDEPHKGKGCYDRMRQRLQLRFSSLSPWLFL